MEQHLTLLNLAPGGKPAAKAAESKMASVNEAAATNIGLAEIANSEESENYRWRTLQQLWSIEDLKKNYANPR